MALGELAGEEVGRLRDEQTQGQKKAVQVIVFTAVVAGIALNVVEVMGLFGRQAGVFMELVL
ncbi:hypothetical protein AB0D04_16280 [Streptomyces sp. NPDC048483]|uniref:hypothetical protein n=1 Tax=Streptomyces sp. NPDC048483 TaxID=3154927 RepID=UPI00341E8F65